MLDKINKLTRKIAIRPTLMVSQGRVKAGDFLMAPKMRQALQIWKRKNMLYVCYPIIQCKYIDRVRLNYQT